MKLTVQQLKRAVPQTNSVRAAEFVEVFNEWSEKFGISTPIRTVHFLAQVFLESGCLRYTEEIASGAAYDTGAKAKALGNTPEKDGDGQRYKGRGFLQLTGRRNYQAYQDSGFCVGDLMSHPEWLAKSPGHTKSAMWFWWKNGLNALADTDNGVNSNDVCKAITRKVNGAYSHLADRQYYMRRFRREFGL
jgi:putative chitinase